LFSQVKSNRWVICFMDIDIIAAVVVAAAAAAVVVVVVLGKPS
jgi:hypothetical protein